MERVFGGTGFYLGGGGGANTSRLRPGSGFGLGLGAFFTSLRPLSLLPMPNSLPRTRARRKGFCVENATRVSTEQTGIVRGGVITAEVLTARIERREDSLRCCK